MSASPKTRFLASAIKGTVLVITNEDKDWWVAAETGYGDAPKAMDAIVDSPPVDTVVLGEVLQRVDDPLKYLQLVKQKTKRIVLTVPNEWSWSPQYSPFKNAGHKHLFDAEMLGALLEEAGLTYVMKSIDYSGWAFLGAECSA